MEYQKKACFAGNLPSPIPTVDIKLLLLTCQPLLLVNLEKVVTDVNVIRGHPHFSATPFSGKSNPPYPFVTPTSQIYQPPPCILCHKSVTLSPITLWPWATFDIPVKILIDNISTFNTFIFQKYFFFSRNKYGFSFSLIFSNGYFW